MNLTPTPFDTSSREQFVTDVLTPYFNDHADELPFPSRVAYVLDAIVQQTKLPSGDTLHFRFTFNKGILEILPRNIRQTEGDGGVRYDTEEVIAAFRSFLQFWEGLANHLSANFLQFQYAWFTKALGEEETNDLFDKQGYQYITASQGIFLGRMGVLEKKSESYIKPLKENALPQTFLDEQDISALFLRTNGHDPLFYYHASDKFTYMYHYLGHEGQITLSYEEEAFHLVEPSIRYKRAIADILEAPVPLQDLLEKVAAIRRIPNLYEPDNFHTRRSLGRFPEQLVDAVFSHLSNKTSPIEVERFFAANANSNFPKRNFFKEKSAVFIQGSYFLYTQYGFSDDPVERFDSLEALKVRLQSFLNADLDGFGLEAESEQTRGQ